jgi:lactate permease
MIDALAALRGMGIRGAPAGAMALLALCLIPWGGLGPGTLLGAALIGLPAQDVARITALPSAVWVLALGPVLVNQLDTVGALLMPSLQAIDALADTHLGLLSRVVAHGAGP